MTFGLNTLLQESQQPHRLSPNIFGIPTSNPSYQPQELQTQELQTQDLPQTHHQQPEHYKRVETSTFTSQNVNGNVSKSGVKVISDSRNPKSHLFTLQDNHSKEIVTFGTKEYTGDARQHNKWRYVYCRDEKILFHKFMDYWVENYPDVITGWNSQFFDLAYLWRRMCHVIGEDHARRLSPWKIVHEREIFVKGNQEFAIAIAGIAQLDYLDLYKRFKICN